MPESAWTVELVTFPSPLFDQATELRFRVLHEPFGVSRDDRWGDDDPFSVHAMALAGGRVVGYARLILEEDGVSAQIRQVAVAEDVQRTGVGTALMTALIADARARRLERVWLNARVPAVPFYERLGFVVTSDVFHTPRTYLPHRRMELAS